METFRFTFSCIFFFSRFQTFTSCIPLPPPLSPPCLFSAFHSSVYCGCWDCLHTVLHSSASICPFFILPLCQLFPPLCLSLSSSSFSSSSSLSLPLRSQWVWLRGACGAPPLSLAIKAMPTPRLHMSSHQSKRGDVLLSRSVSRSANASTLTFVCPCFGWTSVCLFLLPLTNVYKN